MQTTTISTGYTPRPAFIPFHRRTQRWASLVCHRRAGKTVACVADLGDAALRSTKEAPRFAYVAPYYTQAKDVAWLYLKRFVGNIHEEQLGDDEKEALRIDVENRLRAEFGIATTVDQNLFDSVLLGIEEEYFYKQKLLPEIVAKRDLVLRENFLRSSGLDLFRIEELEAEYLRSLEPPAAASA